AANDTWVALDSSMAVDSPMREATISTLGRVVLGAEPIVPLAAGGCLYYPEEVQLADTAQGLDLQFFHAACERQLNCYAHGHRTYRKPAEQCLNDFHADTMGRCEAICLGRFGVPCATLDETQLAEAEADGLTASLYETCKVLAGRMYEHKLAVMPTEYPD